MAKTVKEAKADIFLRDTDSQSLFNNSGVLSFKYYHEWNDCYNQVTGETAQIAGEVYDETTNSYKPNCPEGFSPVFNGRLSALWDNIVNCFPNEVEAMYVKMRGNGLTYQDMLTKYKDFWKYWCENLYNADAFGYANTNNFTKAYGDKVQVMDYFFGKRQRYLDSKYHCGSSVGNNLRLRLYEVGRGFAIKHYQAIYCTLQWGVGNFDDNRNIKPGTYSYMPFKFSNPQDATFDIDDADLITELSTYVKGSNGNYTIYGLEGLGDFKFDLNMGLLKRLTKFVMNYTASKPNTREVGTNFDLSKMGMLRQVIVRNVKNLEKSIILSSDLLEEIDFTNTPIIGVTTPPTDMLTKLVLPNSIKELNLVGYTNLQARYLQVAGYSNIETLHIEDCPNLDSYEIVKTCYEAGAKLSNVVIKGINWEIDNLDTLLYLAKNNASLAGTINVTTDMTLEDKILLISAFGDIDNKNNSLHIIYDKYTITSVSITGKKYLDKTGDYQFMIKVSPTKGNNIKALEWGISDNTFAIINKQTGIVTVDKVGTESNADKATISLTLTLDDNSQLTATKEVCLYKKSIALGDYIFNDASYSDQLEDGLYPIAIVFYIEPTKREWVLAITPKDDSHSVMWGLSSASFSSIQLGDTNNQSYSVFDIASIDNISNLVTIIDENILDVTNTRNDGFKSYDTINTISDLGFQTITQIIYNELKSYLDDIGLKVGDMIAKGQLNTLRIMAHRNRILNDSNIQQSVPVATKDLSESTALTNCIRDIVANHNNQDIYSQYYYPQASYCYAYEPQIKGDVNDKVSAHHWFLPSIGEVVRFIWHTLKGYNYENKYAIFSKGFADGIFIKQTGLPSSTENGTKDYITGPTTSFLSVGASGLYGNAASYSEFNINKKSANNFRPVLALKIK